MITTPDAARAREYWTQSAFNGRVREVQVPVPGPGEVLIETELSGISPGTEALIHRGDVPDSVAELMRAPLQLGDLPFPVSHGYLNVGTVRQGPADLVGRRVFTLAGHRSHVTAPISACHLVDEAVPAERALLAGVAEVGLNALWEAPVTLGDRIAVLGGGLVGLVTALLVQGVSPSRLQLIEIDPARARFAADLGLPTVSPEDAAADNDVVLHASATAEGLRRALEVTGDDGSVVEMSWYGDRSPQVPLGADFHARRLRLLGTQVGQVAAPKRLRRSRTQRLDAALSMLDDRFDALLTGRSPVERLPEVMDDFAAAAQWTRNQLLHVVTYEGEE